MNLSIREYTTAQGKCPFRDWLKSLDISVQPAFKREYCDSRLVIWPIINLLATVSGRLV